MRAGYNLLTRALWWRVTWLIKLGVLKTKLTKLTQAGECQQFNIPLDVAVFSNLVDFPVGLYDTVRYGSLLESLR